MTSVAKKKRLEDFVARWKAKEGNEQREANSFWIELTELLGMNQPTRLLDFERKVRGRRIDVFYEDMGILIENKSRGVDLDRAYERGRDEGGDRRMVTPYEQAKWYADNLPRSISPRWVVVCNFDEIRIHDLNLVNPGTDYVALKLEELPEQFHLLSFFIDRSQSRLVKEMELSVKAGEIVGKLYKAFEGQYLHLDTDLREQRSLNVLIVRIVFLLYAEDAGLLQEHQAFGKYLKNIDAAHMRQALINLFQVLDTPESLRDPYLDPDLAAFPYVNGGLFAKEDVVVPQFTEQMRLDLILNASMQFDWKGISPTIFGAVFESTLNPETRRAGGMHYTSIENIHKVIDPLFLDDLKAELADIEAIRIERKRKFALRRFQTKLAEINVLDPACGSGNFLTESYASLRKLENRVISDLSDGNGTIGMTFDEAENPIKVSIGQLYGIEINDFAVSVAKTALWIAEEQMMEETQEILMQDFDFLPLKSNSNICEGNALRVDWNDVLPAEKCSYIIGNPPFIGSSLRSKEQTDDMGVIAFDGERKWGKIDYCGAWYRLALNQMERNNAIKAAFVSTNSLCQGEQVAPMWEGMFNRGVVIGFAWRTFIWDSEANDKAHVHCVIIGFWLSDSSRSRKKLFEADGSCRLVDNINPYLYSSETVFLRSRSSAIDGNHLLMTQGSKPVDGGYLIFEEGEAKDFCRLHPDVEAYMRPYIGAREFINGKKRYVLWLKQLGAKSLDLNDDVAKRLTLVKEKRLSSPTKEFRKYASSPWLFVQDRQPDSYYLVVPRTTSGRRVYLPLGFNSPEIIASDKLIIVPNASLYDFGLLSSLFHSSWMRVVTGRLKSDYEYSSGVYNNMAYPDPTDGQRDAIESCAQAVLDARGAHPDKSLADLYDPDEMPPDLLAAHRALDAAVEAAYGVDFNGDEEKIVAHLFKLYAERTGEQ